MICDQYSDGLTICREQLEETHREQLEERWCFNCRRRTPFLYLVHAPTSVSYYDPSPSIRCGACGQVDGDCGFGRWREWGGS